MKVGEDLKEAGGSAPRVSSRIVAADVRRRIWRENQFGLVTSAAMGVALILELAGVWRSLEIHD